MANSFQLSVTRGKVEAQNLEPMIFARPRFSPSSPPLVVNFLCFSWLRLSLVPPPKSFGFLSIGHFGSPTPALVPFHSGSKWGRWQDNAVVTLVRSSGQQKKNPGRNGIGIIRVRRIVDAWSSLPGIEAVTLHFVSSSACCTSPPTDK